MAEFGGTPASAAPIDPGPAAIPASPAAAPAPAPVAAAEPAPSPIALPAEPAAPSAAAPAPAAVEPPRAADAPKPATVAETPSLLEGAKAPDGLPKSAEPAAVAQPAQPAQVAAPTYTEFTFPEGIKPDPERFAGFTAAMTKHNLPQEAAQEILNIGTSEMKRYADHLQAEQHRAFNATRESWRNEIKSDPELGGAGHDTAMGAIARMRDMFVPENDRGSFDQFLRVTGAGDHPAFMRLLHNAARYFDEPQAMQAPTNISPPPNNGRAPGGRRASIYDHPSSQKR